MGPVSRVRGGVLSRIGPAVPLWFLEGPLAGRRDLWGADSRRCGALPLPVTNCSGQGLRVPCCMGCGSPDGVASLVRGGVFPVSARGELGPWGVPKRLHEGAAEGTEDLVHKGSVRCLGFRLSADGGQQSSAQR